MIFKEHSNLLGQHAFLSASKHHWINYEDEKIDRVYIAALAARKGTELHEFAHEAIRLGIKLPKTPKTLHLYVNDAIGYRMASEQVLYYSDNCFGTADSISFHRSKLRIHDLKTGVTKTSEHQLEVYAALFCLEYRVKPFEIEMELRIYQNDEIKIYEGDPDVIVHIMDRIITFDKRIQAIRMEMLNQ
jgi:hypothetical protein